MPRLVYDQLFGTDAKVVDADLVDNALRSKQFATVVDLLGYGEIEGFRKPTNSNPSSTDSLDVRKDIFLDGTPIVNANGDKNFEEVEVFFKSGTKDQTPIQEINAIENTIPVGVEVTKDVPITRTISNTSVDKVRVTLQIPLLQKVKDGEIVGTSIQVSIRITENDGTVSNPVVKDKIAGRVINPFLKDYEIILGP